MDYHVFMALSVDTYLFMYITYISKYVKQLFSCHVHFLL